MSNNENTENSVSVLNWVVSIILLGIPLLNFVLILVWAFGGTSYASKKNFAQAIVVLWVIVAILVVLALLLLPMASADTQEFFQQWLNRMEIDIQSQSTVQQQ